jgi:hypothetical protein
MLRLSRERGRELPPRHEAAAENSARRIARRSTRSAFRLVRVNSDGNPTDPNWWLAYTRFTFDVPQEAGHEAEGRTVALLSYARVSHGLVVRPASMR